MNEIRAVITDRWFDGTAVHGEPVRLRLSGPEGKAQVTAIEPFAAETPKDDHDLDARGRLVIPGLINAHCHVARGGYFEPEEPPFLIGQTLRNFHRALEAGVTSVGDMGCTVPMLDALRELTRACPTAGPRIVGAGPILTVPKGYPFNWVSELWRYVEAAIPFDSERDVGRTVERLARGGVDHFKVAIMNQTFLEEPMPAVTPAIARTLVTEAHRLKRRVFAHAHSNLDYEVALDAGIDGLMHSTYEPLTPELVARVRDAGVSVCPTLWVYESTCYYREHRLFESERFQRHATRGLLQSWRRFADALDASPVVFPKGTIPAGMAVDRAKELMRIGTANLRLLHEAGVPIVFGNDGSFGLALLGRPVDELEAMERAGLDAVACLRAATSAAADLLGLPDVGRIALGAAADLVVVDPRVEQSIRFIEQPEIVLVGGQRITAQPDRLRDLRTAGAYLEGTLRTMSGSTRRVIEDRLRARVQS